MFKKLLTTVGLIAVTLVIACATSSAQYVSSTAGNETAAESVVTILLASDGESHAVGSGLVVRADGYVMTPYSLVKDYS